VFRVHGLGSRVLGLRVQGTGFSVFDVGLRVKGEGSGASGVSGSVFGVQCLGCKFGA
jgi:hypothetical protein